MTQLQHQEPPAHPLLDHASSVSFWVGTGVGGGVTLVAIAGWLGWIADQPWISPLLHGAIVCFALGDALQRLSKIRRDSLTRRMKRVLALILPAMVTFLDPDDFPTRAALASFFVFGVAFTLDTQTGFPARSRDWWLATAGTLGFALFCVGATIPNYAFLLASWPLLMMALGAGLRLAEVDALGRDEDGAVRASSPP